MGVVLAPNYELAEPRPAALIEALRAVGYTIQAAIADLIDNSITAGARTVWIRFEWAGRSSYIVITDDGHGMTEAELSDAMRPGNRSPLEEREPGDLGRFGLGLKTASFSQARRLTVGSRRGSSGRASIRRWDLEYVGETGEWRLLKEPAPGSASRIAHLDTMSQGTTVLWECMDRVVGDTAPSDDSARSRFHHTADEVVRHLGMVFHQYLEGSHPDLRIYVNGTDEEHRVRPWNPFADQHPSTIALVDERVTFGRCSVLVKGYVLPHKDRMTEAEFADAAGPAGWNAQQGFYVYRNRRLLAPGGWLGLNYTNEEHYKLARIRIEIPNSTDQEWEIDVKKSRARPPPALRQRLRELAEIVRRRAREVFVHRGRISAGTPQEMVRRAWKAVTRDGRLAYTVDRKHPLVAHVIEQATTKQHTKSIEALLRLLEATVPVQQIWLDTAEKPEVHAAPFEREPPAAIREVMIQAYRALIAGGVSPAMAKQRLLTMDPFNSFPELVASVSERES